MAKKTLIPPVDVFENDDQYLLILDMPGTDKDSIEVSAESDTLTVTGKVHQVSEEWKPILREFEMSDYKREFSIGNKVNRDKIEASYNNGVLTITLAKSEQAKPRKIEVKMA